MAEESELAPHKSAEGADLQTLMEMALANWGDGSPASLFGDMGPLFLLHANMIVEDVRQHPYWVATNEIDYYESLSDKTSIPDIIMIAGLTARHAVQQRSQNAQALYQDYYRVLNQTLWNRYNGNTKVQMRPMDGGSNPYYEQGTVSSINGLPTESSS